MNSCCVSSAWSDEEYTTPPLNEMLIHCKVTLPSSIWSGSPDNYSLYSDDKFRSGCRNVSHHYRQKSFSELNSPGRSNYTITRNFSLEWNDEIDRYDNWILRYALGDIEELFSAELEESSTSITACLKNVLQSTSRSNSESGYSKENTITLTEKVWKRKLQPGILSSSRLQSFCVAELCDCSRKFAPSFWLIICNHFPTLQDL